MTFVISRRTARQILLGVGIALLLAPPVFTLLTMGGYPSPDDHSLGGRFAYVGMLDRFLRALVPAAFLWAVMTRPKKMLVAYWLVPAYFAMSGLATTVSGLLLLADPVIRAWRATSGEPSATGALSLLLGVLLWLVRPIESESDDPRTEAISPDAGETAPA